MKRARSASPASSSTTEACEIPTDASSSRGFTIRGNRSADGRTNSAPAWNTVKSGTRMPWKARIFLLIDLLRATSSPVGGLPVCCHPCISNTAATAYSCCAFPRKLSQPLKTSSGWNAAS